jgi:hypothetical protein
MYVASHGGKNWPYQDEPAEVPYIQEAIAL